MHSNGVVARVEVEVEIGLEERMCRAAGLMSVRQMAAAVTAPNEREDAIDVFTGEDSLLVARVCALPHHVHIAGSNHPCADLCSYEMG